MGRVGHRQYAPHDRMDAAMVGVAAGREAGQREGFSWRHGTRVEGAGSAVVHAGIVRDGVMGWSGVVPANRVAAGDRHGGRNEIG